jgi:hypothetical protein
VGVHGDTGTFDSPNVGLGGAFALTPGRWRLEVGAEYWLTQTITMPPAPPNLSRGGKLDLFTVGIAGCYALVRDERTRIDLMPCTGAEVGLFEGSAFGVSEPGSGATTWSAFKVGALGAWRVVGPLGLRLDLDAIVPFSRPTFVIGGVNGIVHRPAPLSGRAGVGVELRF